MVNILLANLVRLFHIFIILFVLIAPFINDSSILILHISFCICLMIHWIFNSDQCVLTHLEKKLRGVSDDEAFTYKFIAPMYNITHTRWNNLVWIITIIMCLISIYNLINNEKIRYFLNELKKEKSFTSMIKIIQKNH